MTNLQSLSVFVTERLTLAAQEIFKAVEVTVTEYHEEISRSRQENELLKRRLLEAGIDFYSELQPSLSVVQESEANVGQPVCGEPWNQQNEKIQVKLELSAAQEETQDSQLQIAMAKEPISPKPCLQNEQKIEEMFHVQTTDGSTDTLLPAGPFMQIKEEPSELVPDLRLETFCESQTSISADPSSAVASSHCSGFEEELDSHRLSSVHKTVRSKMRRRKRRRLEVLPSKSVEAISQHQAESSIVGAIPVSTAKKTFVVESLLKSCNFREKRRYHVSLEEIKRRIGPPEFMSLNALVSYLRTAKSNKKSLRKELIDLGVVPPQITRLTSLCSKLTEDEAQDLAVDLGKLASGHIDFKSAAEHQISFEDKTTELMRAKSFREFLEQTKKALAPFMSRYDTVTHGLGTKTFDVTVQIIEAFVTQVIKRLTDDLES